MTFPAGISVGPWVAHPHVVFETLAYVTGFRLYLRQRRRRGDHVGDAARWSLVTAAAVGAVIGSRLLFWLEDPAATLHYLRVQPLVFFGGKTIVGALIGGWIAVELFKRRLGIRDATGDLFAVPLAAGICIGRIGCFLSGLPDGTYGVATTLPWGVDLGDGIARHPVALYESLFLLAVAAGLARLQPRLHRGTTFKLFMASYLAFRVAADTLKPGTAIAFGLTAIQWACIGGLTYYAWWFMRRRALRLEPALPEFP